MHHATPQSTERNEAFRLGLRALLAACALGGATLAAGCGESQEAEVAARMEEVNRALLTLTAGAGAPASNEFKSRTYASVISELQPIASRQDSPYQSAAKGLLARAQAGQAEMKAAEASAVAARALDAMSRARASFDRYVAQHALADALVGFDSSPERAAIEQRLAETDTALREAQSAKAKVESVVSDLRRQVAEHAETTRRLRDEEAGFRGEALRAEAEARTEIIERAVAAQRRADAAEVEMAKAAAMVERHRPELEAAESEIGRITRQRENLTLSLRESQERERVVAGQADANRKLAAEAEGEVLELVRAVDGELRGEAAELFDEALRLLAAALSSSRSAVSGAGTDGRAPAQLAVARLQLQVAEVHRERAHLWETFAALLGQAAEVDPPMSARGEIASLLGSAEDELAAAQTAHREALAEARAALEQAGARGEAQERVERAVQRLGALTGASAEQPADAWGEQRPPAGEEAGEPEGG